MSVDELPNFAIEPKDRAGAGFLARGVRDYHAAARYVRALPYGRNSDRADYLLVLVEGRGTCSTKHALLAELAREHGRRVELRLGVYEMDEQNTPGVGAVLARFGLERIPEAHCYLAYRGVRVDLTLARSGGGRPQTFVHEERIEPSQIGPYKVERHRKLLREWATAHDLDFEYVWRAREECIHALAEDP